MKTSCISVVSSFAVLLLMNCSKSDDPSTPVSYNGIWNVTFEWHPTNDGPPGCITTYVATPGAITVSNGEFTNTFNFTVTDPNNCAIYVTPGETYNLFLYGTLDSSGNLIGYGSTASYYSATPLLSFNGTAGATGAINATGTNNLTMVWTR